MAYQIADLVIGPFSEIVETLEEAEDLLKRIVGEGQSINERDTPDGYSIPDAAEFFCIVDVETGEEI